MSNVNPIIELHPWLAHPSGRALLEWEQTQVDRLVSDLFGFHAVQLGMPELDALRCNRMPHKWLALDERYASWVQPSETTSLLTDVSAKSDMRFEGTALGLRCSFAELPFPSHSLDLVVLPHALELSHDPHAMLREVERVLVPEGRVLIAGFNPTSLWGMTHKASRLGLGSNVLSPQGELLAYWRLRDWLRLLNFGIEAGGFGCYRPMTRSAGYWHRLRWMEHAGERWWPVLGAVYFVVAVKRAHGMRLVGRTRRNPVTVSARPAVVAKGQYRRELHMRKVER